MGIYINPGNQAFKRISGSDYVDKTGMIRLINDRIGGDDSLVCVSRPRRFGKSARSISCRTHIIVCVSRPRRFGKSYAAKMLAAYYDSSCDSHELFDKKVIARSKTYPVHLNHYNVIYLEITSFVSSARRQGISLQEVPNRIVDPNKG